MSKLICIDPGHAKNTPGKRAGTNPTFFEYESNRKVALILAKKLKAVGFRTMFSCNIDSPTDLSLSQRGRNAVNAKADAFVSVHSNAHNDPKVTGTETFIQTESQSSLPLAQAVQSAMVASFRKPNRGVKRANFGVLRATYKNMLAILTEADFFTNQEARKWMLTAAFNEAYAQAVFVGICQFYKVSYPSNPNHIVKPDPPVKTDDIGKNLLRVKADKLWVYDKPDWNARTFQVSKGEAFTVARELTVNGSKMYQLVSGLYITASTQFVEFDGKVQSTPVPASPKVDNPYIAAAQAFLNSRSYPTKATFTKLVEDGIAGRHTLEALVRVYQYFAGVGIDGKFGPQSKAAANTLRRGSTHQWWVRLLQSALNVKGYKLVVDGNFGSATEQAVRAFQSARRITSDGIAGANTWEQLL